jgi:hypothetical protein
MQYRKLNELKKLPNNPRIIRDKQFKTLCDSIRDNPKYFEARPLILSDRTGELVIIAGNQRYEAAKSLKLKEVPTFLIEGLDEAKEREIIIRDNISNGEFDIDLLANEWSDLPLVDWGVDLPEDWLVEEKTEPADAEPQIDRAEELNKTWRVKTGDLWQIGEHRLLCGDSTKAEDVARVMGEEKAALCLTDPPYEIETKGGGILKKSSAMKGIRDLKIDSFSPESLVQLSPTSVYCCNKPLIKAYIALAEKWGVSWDLCVYHKQNTVPNYGGHMMTDLEYIFLIGDQSPETGIGQEKELYSKLFSGGKDTGNETAWSKPTELFSKFIRLYAKGGIVVDPFLGSGTTMVACQNLNRKCRGIEISPAYCSVILQRMQDAFPGIEIKRLS